MNKEEKTAEMQIVEGILDLVDSDIKLVNEYGVYIDEYYKLPMKNRRNVCKAAYNYFMKHGSYDVKVLCTVLIPHEAMSVEEKVDPVVQAIRESHELRKQNPVINVDGIRTEYDDTNSIKQNIKRKI